MKVIRNVDAYRDRVYKKIDHVAELLKLSKRKASDTMVDMCEACIEMQELAEPLQQVLHRVCSSQPLDVDMLITLLCARSRADTLRWRLKSTSATLDKLDGYLRDTIIKQLGVTEKDINSTIGAYLDNRLKLLQNNDRQRAKKHTIKSSKPQKLNRGKQG